MGRLYQSRTLHSLIREHDRQLKKVGSASILKRSGLSVSDEGVTQVDGDFQSADFNGDLTTRDPGTTGWAMDSGAAAFGDLILRPGSVGNDALTNPTAPGAFYVSTTGFSLTTTLTNKLTNNVVVPAGFTTAHVTVVGRIYAINNTAGLDYLIGQTNIAGFNGYGLPIAVSGSNGSGTIVSPFAQVLTGLTPGSTFAVQMAAQTSFGAWASNTTNTIELSGSITWYR